LTLQQELSTLQKEIESEQSRVLALEEAIQGANEMQERGILRVNLAFEPSVLLEMKAYVGGDEQLELIQKQRGFKTYRDLYSKKIAELETDTKQMRDQQKQILAEHEPNAKRVEFYSAWKRLFQVKLELSTKTEASLRQRRTEMLNVCLIDRIWHDTDFLVCSRPAGSVKIADIQQIIESALFRRSV
jgi:hypothetical protein